jgi:hypothetical protein
MLADSGEIISQSPEPQSVSGDELYTPQVGDVTRGVLQYMLHRWSERQVSYRERSWYSVSPLPPYKLCSQSQETLQNLAEGL